MTHADASEPRVAERSPLVVISGALGTDERRRNRLLHHKVRDFDTPAAATLLGKSVFPELHPAYLGVHESRWGSSTYATTSQ